MITLPYVLLDLQPETSAAFQKALDTVLPLVDESLLTLCRQQLQSTHRRQAWRPASHATPLEQSACRLADQFAVSVEGVGEDHLQPLEQELGSIGLSTLVNALYLLDMGLRLEAVVPGVIESDAGSSARLNASSTNSPVTADQESVMAEAIAEFAAAAVRANQLDPVTGELVRLRCAQIHHCRLCGSLRQRSALNNGFDESMADRVSRYEQGGFGDSVVAALRLVDTLIMFPADLDAELVLELKRHYSPEQISELCFDVVKWSQQKALVAMGSDAPPWQGIHVLDFNDRGDPLFQGPVANFCNDPAKTAQLSG